VLVELENPKPPAPPGGGGADDEEDAKETRSRLRLVEGSNALAV